jgi:hypothetical protein
MDAHKKTPGAAATAPACEGWSFATESHQSKRTNIVGQPGNGGKAEPIAVGESLTFAQCEAMRADALRFGYALTWAVVPGVGLRWYARRDGGAPLVIGETAVVQKFLSMHARWVQRPDHGRDRMDRWLRQKMKAQIRRGKGKVAPHRAAPYGAGR